jgi:hypothetical protein
VDGYRGMNEGNMVYLLWTQIGLHGVYKNEETVEDVREAVVRKLNLKTWVEAWELIND